MTKRQSSSAAANAALQAALAKSGALQRSTSSGINFIKMTGGINELKILLDPNGLLNHPMRTHSGVNDEGRYMEVLDLDWLAQVAVSQAPELWNHLVEKGRVSQGDLSRIVSQGDPANRLAAALDRAGVTRQELQEMGRDSGTHVPLFQTKLMWNVFSVETKQAGLWAAGITTGEKFTDLLQFSDYGAEDVLGGGPVSFIVKGNGKDGFARRYEYFLQKKEPAESVGEGTSLVDFLGRKFLTLEEKLEFVNRSYGELMTRAGVIADDLK